jgi:hypothetical protein
MFRYECHFQLPVGEGKGGAETDETSANNDNLSRHLLPETLASHLA